MYPPCAENHTKMSFYRPTPHKNMPNIPNMDILSYGEGGLQSCPHENSCRGLGEIESMRIKITGGGCGEYGPKSRKLRKT